MHSISRLFKLAVACALTSTTASANYILSQVLTPSDLSVDALFGHSVAIDGNKLVLGSHYDDDKPGSAYLFEKDASTGFWDERVKLQASNVDDIKYEDYFGYSTGISGDKVLVGAPYDRGEKGGWYTGAVYAFDWGDSEWEPLKLVSSGISYYHHFGWAADIYGDKLVVGAWGKDSVYIFDWDSSAKIWSQQAKFTVPANGFADPYYGHAVAIQENTIVVGMDARAASGLNGSAYVYVQDSAETWIESKIEAPTPSLLFGFSVAVYANTVVVGAYTDDGGAGAAYVFVPDDDTGGWKLQAKLTAIGSFELGESVAVFQDTIIAGAPGSSNAYVFVKDSAAENGWLLEDILTPPSGDSVPELFGTSISLSADTAVIGAKGAAYVFNRPNTSSSSTSSSSRSGKKMRKKRLHRNHLRSSSSSS